MSAGRIMPDEHCWKERGVRGTDLGAVGGLDSCQLREGAGWALPGPSPLGVPDTGRAPRPQLADGVRLVSRLPSGWRGRSRQISP